MCPRPRDGVRGMGKMDYSVEQDANAVEVLLDGEVDLQHSPTLRKVLLKAVENDLPVLVNMEKVSEWELMLCLLMRLRRKEERVQW